MADPLADLILRASRDWNSTAEDGWWKDHVAAAVRAHIAAVLDAEEAKWVKKGGNDFVIATVVTSFGSLRAALLGAEESR